MKIRVRTIFVFTLAGLAGASLLHTSQNVQTAEVELTKLTAEVNQEKDSIRILKTEWAYLNNPERLEVLAKQYLKLQPSDPEHIKTGGEQLPVKIPLPEEEIMEAQPIAYVPPPPSKPSPPARKTIPTKAIPKEKTLDDVLNQVTNGGVE